MISRAHLSTVLLLAALVWGVLLLIAGVAVSISWLKHLSSVTGVMLLLLAAFDLWLWRLSFLQGWFVKRPILRGTWQALLNSSWVDPSTGRASEPIEGFMVIHQTYSSLSLRLLTSQSTSVCVGAEIIASQDGTMSVAGVYRNEPRQRLRENSPIHYGAFLIDVLGRPVDVLRGHYWTDRNTSGEIQLLNHRGSLVYDYDIAKRRPSALQTTKWTIVTRSIEPDLQRPQALFHEAHDEREVVELPQFRFSETKPEIPTLQGRVFVHHAESNAGATILHDVMNSEIDQPFAVTQMPVGRQDGELL
jgi:hypothetical protein